MYKKHKITMVSIFLITFLMAFQLKIDYFKISREITIFLSTFLLSYEIAFLILLRNKEKIKILKNTEDKILNGKSQLGVLTNYLRNGYIIIIINIILSCLSSVYKNYIISSITIGLFTMKLYFIHLLIKILINKFLYEI